MPTRIEERFVVQAPLERVWSYLIDPRQVVTCLPGAELTEVLSESEFAGAVKVKVGPVTTAYRGRVRLLEKDEATRRVRMSGEGREASGAGSAKMSMESQLAELPGGGTEVVVRAEVDLAGRIVQLGRGMIEQVAHQLFGQFATCVRTRLEAQAVRAERGEAESKGERNVPAAGAALAATAPVAAIPLLLRAFWAAIADWVRRVLGGGHPRARR